LTDVGKIQQFAAMTSPPDLAARVRHHLAQTKESPSAFGRRVANDPHLVRQLDAGREPRRRTVERIEAALRGEVTDSPPPKRGVVAGVDVAFAPIEAA
jgi:hypothetical protein